MGRRPEPPPELGQAPFAARDVRHLLTRDQLASGAYERLCRGAYRVTERATDTAAAGANDRVAAGANDRAAVRASDPASDRASTAPPYGVRVQGLFAVLPARAVLVGRTAAWALDAWTPWPDDPVEVAVGPSGSARSRPGLRVSARTVCRSDVVGTRRGRATTSVRTALDLARLEPARVALPVVDAVLARSCLTTADLLTALSTGAPGRGSRRARAVLPLCDPRSQSPRESLLRLTVHEAGLPRPVLQHEVRDAAGRFVARLDLAWPEHRVALEYDGWPHQDPAQRSRDLRRHNALRALGWVVVQVDAAGFRRPEVSLAQVRAALAC